MQRAPTIIAVAGPTGAGKTELSLDIAERFGAEIVNCDSRQVFRRLDIGSAKPTPAERARVPHHLFDVVDPDQAFDAARYRQLAVAAIEDIHRRGRRVLLVGGTGLYLKVVRGGLFEGPPRDPELRARLAATEERQPSSLHRCLLEVDPQTAQRLHPNDTLRLIRALEVYQLTGKPISAWQREHAFTHRQFAILTLAITLPRAELYARINARCRQMIADGLIEEARTLLAEYPADLPSLQSPGYREIGDYLAGRCDLDAAIERMAQATRRLAKRQLTWLRGDPEVIWCDPASAAVDAAALQWATVEG